MNNSVINTKKLEELLNSFSKPSELDETFEDQSVKYNIQYLEAIPVVSLLRNENVKGYIIQNRQVKKPKNETFNEAETINISKLNLTGSPLDNPIDSKLLKFSEETFIKSINKEVRPQYKPLCVNSARYLLAKFGSNSQIQKMQSPLWILCDGAKEDVILFGSQLSEDKFVRTIIKQIGISGMKKNQKLNQETIKNYHKFGFSDVHDKLDVSVSSCYSLSINTGEIDELNRVRLNFDWKKCNEIFEKPPLDALCYLEMRVKLSSSSNYMNKQYKELQLLESISKTTPRDSEQTRHNSLLMKRVCDVLKAESERKISTNVLSSECCYKEYVLKNDCIKLSSTSRDEIDFTDLVWLLLKEYSSLEELMKCMKTIFKAVHEKTVIPLIYKSNTTYMSKILSSQKYLADINKKIALEMLVEIGVEKLMRDYFHFFQANKLASKDHLLRFLGRQASVSECLEFLKQLHYCVELIQTFTLHLKLGQDHVQLFTKQILQFYMEQRNKIEEKYFQYPLQTCLVSSIISENQCISWIISMSSTDSSYKKETLCCVTPFNPCPWSSLESKLYYLLMTCVEDRIFDLPVKK